MQPKIVRKQGATYIDNDMKKFQYDRGGLNDEQYENIVAGKNDDIASLEEQIEALEDEKGELEDQITELEETIDGIRYNLTVKTSVAQGMPSTLRPTISSTPQSLIATGSDPAGVAYNTEATLTPTLKPGTKLASTLINGTETEPDENGVFHFTMDGNKIIQLVVDYATYDLTVNTTNATVTVTKNGVAIDPGEDALTYGEEITITAAADANFTLSSLLVNGTSFTSGGTYTVEDAVVITAVAEAES